MSVTGDCCLHRNYRGRESFIKHIRNAGVGRYTSFTDSIYSLKPWRQNMEKFFTNMGRKLGTSVSKGKWFYKSLFGSEEESIRAEYVVGKQLAQNVTQEMKVTGEPAVQQLVSDVGEQLRKRVHNKQRTFQFHIAASSDINAFALPGGFVFITQGLFEQIADQHDEIAFVLAHEMMHVVLKHPMNRIIANYSAQMISNIVIKGGAMGMLARQIVGNLLNNCYSRENELEADNYAVRLMYAADFNPNAAKTLLARLKQNSPEDLPVYNYFLSHPAIDERITAIQQLIRERKMG